MDSDESKQGASPPDETRRDSEQPPAEDQTPADTTAGASDASENSAEPAGVAEETSIEDERAGDDLYDPYDDYADDPYGYDGEGALTEPAASESSEVTTGSEKAEEPPSPPPPPSSGDDGDGDDEDENNDGMVRMSFMDHLEELRSRIIKALMGVGVAFFVAIIFANQLWLIVSAPAKAALEKIGADPHLAQLEPMDVFMTVWVKLPMLAAVFLASPWILYQVWAFIAPGLYKRERRWAAPFVICSAGLFILGGLFAYFVAFRFGLTFLLGIGTNINIKPVVSLTKYFDLFVNVMLGVGLVFELPILIFFLILLRMVTPSFLVRNARYAILVIVIIAAIVTPTPDVVNLMLFAVPMCLLYFVGIFAGYLLNLHRDQKKFPWRVIILILAVIVIAVAIAIYVAITYYGVGFQTTWPFVTT